MRRSGTGVPLRGCGVGLRREHYGRVLSERPPVPWFEVMSENFMVPGGRPRHLLERVRADYPVALHGVSLSIGSAEPVRREYLARLKALVDWVERAIVSCKGTGDCGGPGHSCANQNACKRQGYIDMDKETCLRIDGGRLTSAAEKTDKDKKEKKEKH